MFRSLLGLVLCFGIVLAAFAGEVRKGAQDKKTDDRATEGRKGADDTRGQEALPIDNQFLVKAFTSGHKEVQLSKLADQNSKNAKVKQFAQMMIKDHTKANEKISELLKSRKTAVVAGTEKETRDGADRLSKLQNEEFDRAYTQVMVKDHQMAVKLFENQVKNGKDEDVTGFAKETLPTLKGHLQQAQQLAASVGGSDKGGTENRNQKDGTQNRRNDNE
jgi:putative membrane protein